MTSFRVSDPVPWLRDPTPTAAKRRGQVMPAPDKGLDVARLSRKYAPSKGSMPWLLEGTFQAPTGMDKPMFERLCNEHAKKFIEAMGHQGYDPVSNAEVKFVAGIYPSRDLVTGEDRFDYRDIIVRAWFRQRNPGVQRIELDQSMLAPIHSKGN